MASISYQGVEFTVGSAGADDRDDEHDDGRVFHGGEIVTREELDKLPVDSGEDAERMDDDDDAGLSWTGRSRDMIKYHVVTSQAELEELRQQNSTEDAYVDPKEVVHLMKYVKIDGKIKKLWECALCSREFRHQYTLMRHLPTHTDERNYKCETCGKAFRQMSTLAQHKATHSSARPYVCEICQKTFNRVSTLILHRKTHFEDKPHKCEVCGRGFHQRGNLKNHMFSHTNERPYRCELCGRGFNQMSNLMVHKGKAHGQVTQGGSSSGEKAVTAKTSSVTRFVCEVCGKGFQKRNALRSHEESQHNVVKQKPKIKTEPVMTQDDWKSSQEDDTKQADSDSLTSGLLIEAISSSLMDEARKANRTAFALLKSVAGTPSLVKVYDLPNNKQLLIPATTEDIQAAVDQGSGVTTSTSNGKSLQVKISVVATINQQMDEDGQLSVRIEPSDGDNRNSVEIEQPLAESQGAEEEEQDVESKEDVQFIRSLPNGDFEIISQEEAAHLLQEAGTSSAQPETLDFLHLSEDNTHLLLAEDDEESRDNDGDVPGEHEAEIIISQGEDGQLIVQGNQLEFLLGAETVQPCSVTLQKGEDHPDQD